MKPESAEVNRQLQHLRPGRAFQDLATKQYWLFVHIGIEKLPPRFRIEKPSDIPSRIRETLRNLSRQNGCGRIWENGNDRRQA